MPKWMPCILVVVLLHFIYSYATGQRQTLSIGRTGHFYCDNYFMLKEIRTCLGVSGNRIYPLNLLLVRSH